MTRINTNVSSLNAQKTLGRSNTQLQEAMTRLSTGLRINSGKDDPAGLIASEMLRSDIVSTQRAISNSQRANQMIATADSALGQVSDLLTEIRGLVTESANTGALSPDQIAANQLQVDAALESLNRIAQVTSLQGRKLLDGSLDFVVKDVFAAGTTNAATNVADLQIAQANLGTQPAMGVEVNITSAATQAEVRFDVPAGDAAVAATAGMTAAGTPLTGTTTISFEADNTHYMGDDGNNVVVRFVHDDGGTIAAGEIDAYYQYNTADDTHYVVVKLSTDAVSGGGDLNQYSAADIKAAIDAVVDDEGNRVLEDVSIVAGDGHYLAEAGNAVDITLTGGLDATNGVGVGGVVFELAGSTGSQVFNFGEGTTAAIIEDAINAVSDATGVAATVAGNTVTLNSSGYGSKAKVVVDTISGTLTDLEYYTGTAWESGGRAEGTDVVALVNGIAAAGDGNKFSINTATLSMNATVTDGSSANFEFSIAGGGALFQVGPDVVSNQQARIGIGSVNSANLGGASGRLYELGSGQGAELAADPTKAAQIINEVINKVTSLRGRLGAFQKTTLDSNIASLNDTLENLISAESEIRDADFAVEAAALTRSQILVQSGTSVLAIANQNPQNVLALLR